MMSCRVYGKGGNGSKDNVGLSIREGGKVGVDQNDCGRREWCNRRVLWRHQQQEAYRLCAKVNKYVLRYLSALVMLTCSSFHLRESGGIMGENCKIEKRWGHILVACAWFCVRLSHLFVILYISFCFEFLLPCIGILLALDIGPSLQFVGVLLVKLGRWALGIESSSPPAFSVATSALGPCVAIGR